MRKELNLLTDDIFSAIMRLSLPLMGTAFIQMCYSFIDLIWLGRLSTGAVAAVGTCSFFVWIAQDITLIAKTGVSVGLAQAYGKNNRKEAEQIMVGGFWLNLFFCFMVMTVYLIFHRSIISFYHLEKEVEEMANTYFYIISLGLIFTYLNPLFSSTFYAKGNSVTPFKISTLALIFNIVFDPILIFGIGPFPKLDIAGAAIATVLAQAIATLCFLYVGKTGRELFFHVPYGSLPSKKTFSDILQLGVPVCLQSSVQACVGIILNRYIAMFGAVAIAVFSIGAQIESITWMSADGLATAFSAFFGQNYGAGKFQRLVEGRKKGMHLLVGIGLLAGFILFFGAKWLFAVFVPNDTTAITMGADYLRIVSVSELFMAIEIGTAGMLNGLGLTRYPAVNAIVFNIVRIPIAFCLMEILGVNGIWLTMTISCCLKGTILTGIYHHLRKVTKGFQQNMQRYVSRV